MSGNEALYGRSVVASKSRMIGERIPSSYIEMLCSSEVDASFRAETR
jgi:hypothetical protein